MDGEKNEVVVEVDNLDWSGDEEIIASSSQEESHHNEVPQLKNISIMTNKGDGCSIIENSYSLRGTEEYYNPFSNNGGGDVAGPEVRTRIGPLANNTLSCECNTIKHLMAKTEMRYLLSLLPDMEVMNPKQKVAFKTKVLRLINDILTDIS